MRVPIKHDSANGEVGFNSKFGDQERVVAENFRQQILRDPNYIPERIGEELPFHSFVAAFYLIPHEKIVGVMWVYTDVEVLRRSLFFTTLRIPLTEVNPYSIARKLMRGELRDILRHAIQGGSFEFDLLVPTHPVPTTAGPAGRHQELLGSMPLLRESDIVLQAQKEFEPFVTFKPPSKDLQGPEHSPAVYKEKIDIPEKSDNHVAYTGSQEIPPRLAMPKQGLLPPLARDLERKGRKRAENKSFSTKYLQRLVILTLVGIGLIALTNVTKVNPMDDFDKGIRQENAHLLRIIKTILRRLPPPPSSQAPKPTPPAAVFLKPDVSKVNNKPFLRTTPSSRDDSNRVSLDAGDRLIEVDKKQNWIYVNVICGINRGKKGWVSKTVILSAPDGCNDPPPL